MAKHPIELAYAAHDFVPSSMYQHGRRRKMYNPVRTTPALVQAMIHLGKSGMGLRTARRRACEAVYEPEAASYLESLDWDDLLAFLDTIAVFLKAEPQGRKEKGMNSFQDLDQTALSSREASETARSLVGQISGKVVSNKLKQMGAHVTAANDKWEALAALARFYPRKGIPNAYVNALVRELERCSLNSFKQVVAQSLIFYEAQQIEKQIKQRSEKR